MLRLRRLALWLAGAVALYAALGFLVAPPIVRQQLAKALGERLGRRVAIESVRINPFALSASVRNFALKEADGAADAAGFEELSIDVSLASLLRGGVVIEAARLAGPYLRVARLEDRSYSFQDILDRFASAPAAPPDARVASPAFAVYNVRISNGHIDFDDRPAKTQHAVTDIQLDLPFVSSLPKEVDVAVQPRLSAKINGAAFELAGETKPFKDTHEATLRLDLDQLELAKYLEYLPLRVRVASGTLTTRLVLTSAAGRSGALQTLALSGTATLQRLAVRQADGGPLAAIGRLSVELESLDFLKRRAAVKAVRIDAPELDVVRGKDGSFNLRAAFPAGAADEPAKPAAAPREAPLEIRIDQIVLQGGQVRFTDRTPQQPVRATLNDISLLLQGLSSAPESRADVKLTARINRVAPMEIVGKVNVLSKDLFVDVQGNQRDIDLRSASPYSVMYAGYAIASGKLSVKHVVRLQDRKLATENSIRLDQLELGEKVDSPTATSLPVALAVAVLKDRNGVIAVDLPVSASLDDPQARRGQVIGRELGGFISKTGTDPFAVLGADLAWLDFAPGSAALMAEGEAKLKALAGALDGRPGLKLEISARVNPKVDGDKLEALAQARAQAARDWLVGNGKLAAGRVSIVAPKLDGEETRVDFALR